MLGRWRFRLRSRHEEFLHMVSRMLLPIAQTLNASEEDHQNATIVDLDMPVKTFSGQMVNLSSIEPAASLAYLVEQGLKFHAGLLWMEAAVMLDGKGRLVLLAGGSYAGKTTLSLALHLALGWKIVSEDSTMFDISSNCVVPFARPLALRPDSLAKIVAATGVKPIGTLCDEYYFDAAMYYREPVPPEFACALLLTPLTGDRVSTLSMENISQATYVRRLLPLSNLIRFSKGLESITRSLEAGACYVLAGGELKDRIKVMQRLASHKEPVNR
jgi:hypothetical protein